MTGTPAPRPDIAPAMRLARRVLFGATIAIALSLTLLVIGAAVFGDESRDSGDEGAIATPAGGGSTSP